MKFNFKKAMVIALITVFTVNATVITTMESDKRKQILATDVESQAGPIFPDPIDDLSRLAVIVTETINAIRGTSGPLGKEKEYKCQDVQFTAYLNDNGVSQQNVDSYLNAHGKKNENNNANGKYDIDKNRKVEISAEIVNQYFPMEPHITALCRNEEKGTCKNVDKQACTDQFKAYMKAIRKFK